MVSSESKSARKEPTTVFVGELSPAKNAGSEHCHANLEKINLSCRLDSHDGAFFFQTAAPVRSSTLKLHQQSLIPHGSHKVSRCFLTVASMYPRVSEFTMSLHIELSRMEKIPSCRDVVHHAIEGLASC